MHTSEINVVTGAFGFTGKYITRRLLSDGKRVTSLTGHPDRPNPFGDEVSVSRFNFDDPVDLTKSLEGASTLYNTYWIRFPHGGMTYARAVENSRTLVKCAQDAGVRRIVHISIANPSEDSPLTYYSGKAAVERVIRESSLSYAILRPTVLFGPEDILINNITWFIRNYPAFGIPGSGEYGIQPIHVDDLAELAVNLGQSNENIVTDAAGPELFTFNELISMIKEKVRGSARIIHLNPVVAMTVVKTLGATVKDVVLTEDEIKGLLGGLLASKEPPRGHTRLSEWLTEHADSVGREYHSEMARHY